MTAVMPMGMRFMAEMKPLQRFCARAAEFGGAHTMRTNSMPAPPRAAMRARCASARRRQRPPRHLLHWTRAAKSGAVSTTRSNSATRRAHHHHPPNWGGGSLGRSRPKRGRVISLQNARPTQCLPRPQPSAAPVGDAARRSRRSEPVRRSGTEQDSTSTFATLRALPRNKPVTRGNAPPRPTH